MLRKEAHFVECGDTVTREQLEHRVGQGELIIGEYMEALFGFYNNTTGAFKCIVKARSNATIDTSWGVNGYWGATNAGVTNGTIYCADILQLKDGRMLVAHNQFYIETGKMAQLAMVNSDGTLDTTWGYNGFFLVGTLGFNSCRKILQDNDGNFHLFCGVGTDNGLYTYVKISKDGVVITGLSTQYNKLTAYNEAVWADDEKTRIIAVGAQTQIIYNGAYANMTAINPVTGTVDTTWAGNITGKPGFAYYPTTSSSLFSIVRMNDGKFVILRSGITYTLSKILASGSGFDTTWGTEGKLSLGTIYYDNMRYLASDGEELYNISIQSGIIILSRINASGIVVKSVNLTAASTNIYHTIQVFNDKLLLGTNGAGAVKHAEIWSKDLVYESGFDTPYSVYNVRWILPDETTRESHYEFPDETTERWVITTSPDLVGETVKILADGVVLPDQIVNDAGEITFDQPYDEIHWGLGYGSKIRPMRPVTSPEMMASIVTVKQMGISVLNTGAIKVGVSDDDMKDVSFADMKNKCEIEGLFTGTVAVSVPDGYSKNLPLQISTDSPLPCVIRAMIPKLNKTGA